MYCILGFDKGDKSAGVYKGGTALKFLDTIQAVLFVDGKFGHIDGSPEIRISTKCPDPISITEKDGVSIEEFYDSDNGKITVECYGLRHEDNKGIFKSADNLCDGCKYSEIEIKTPNVSSS